MKSVLAILAAVPALCVFTSHSAFAYGGYAAIVYNTTDLTWGTAWSDDGADANAPDSYDRASAEQAAITSCNDNKAHPNTCSVNVDQLEARPYPTATVETWAHNGWVALAVGPASTWGTSGCNDASLQNCHDSQSDAEASALQSCNAKTGANSQCKIVRSFASFVNDYNVDGVRPAAR